MRSIAAICKKYADRKALIRVLDYPASTHTDKRDGTETSYPGSVGLQVPVDIIDVRINWGNVQCLVRPLRGTGTTWVTAERRNLTSRLTVVEDWPDENQAHEQGCPADDALGSRP